MHAVRSSTSDARKPQRMDCNLFRYIYIYIYIYIYTPVFVGTLGSVDVLSSYAVMKSYRQSFMNTGKDNAKNRNPAEAECSQGLR